MICNDEMKFKLEEYLIPKRYIHSLNVMNTCVDLAKRYGVDRNLASIAGLLHDCARDFSREEIIELCKRFSIELDEISKAQPELLHAAVGAKIATDDFEITNSGILDAITYHTTGRENMSMLEKIVFVADYIEPGRNFPGVNEARDLAMKDLDKTIIMALDRTIKHVLTKGTIIHPNTINARNHILLNIGRG